MQIAQKKYQKTNELSKNISLILATMDIISSQIEHSLRNAFASGPIPIQFENLSIRPKRIDFE